MAGSCCESRAACVFARALLVRSAVCELAVRRTAGEREVVECGSPVARTNCETLAALLHERARFPLRLPRPGELLMHAQAMRLHCGGLAGLQGQLQAPVPDVHRMVSDAQQRWGSLTDLPWEPVVQAIVQWQGARRRARPR